MSAVNRGHSSFRQIFAHCDSWLFATTAKKYSARRANARPDPKTFISWLHQSERTSRSISRSRAGMFREPVVRRPRSERAIGCKDTESFIGHPSEPFGRESSRLSPLCLPPLSISLVAISCARRVRCSEHCSVQCSMSSVLPSVYERFSLYAFRRRSSFPSSGG